jgi:cytochrome c-type biogenesis protein CcsB
VYKINFLNLRNKMNILKRLFSMKIAIAMMIIFGAMIGIATFIENDYGTMTVQALIYKTKWFELFLFYFIAILSYQILNFKSYKNKIPVFIFHFSFIIIALGALMTRYWGYEGKLSVREGSSTNKMLSMDRYVQIEARNGKSTAYQEYPIFLSSMTTNNFNKQIVVGNKTIDLSLKEYLPQVEEKLQTNAKNGKEILELMVSGMGSAGTTLYIAKGETKQIGGLSVSFDNNNSDPQSFNIVSSNGLLLAYFPSDAETLNMDTQENGQVRAGLNAFNNRTLYRFDSSAIVLKKRYSNVIIKKVSTSLKPSGKNPEYMMMDISVNGKSKIMEFFPINGESGDIQSINIDGVDIFMLIGSKVIELPFEIYLKDFKLAKYPGSMTPSSYSSEVILKDTKNSVNMPYEIYMNHILDYQNFRLFQTSYDPDEKGTILSVNHDPGTKMTYLGYILLSIGFIWSLFIKNGRFQKLLREASGMQQLSILMIFFTVLGSTHLKADVNSTIQNIDKGHLENFRHLVVQDNLGRMKPVDTMATEIVSKVTGSTTMFGKSASELFLNMMLRPENFQELAMIKISHPQIAKDLGLKSGDKFAKFSDFFTSAGQYKLFDSVQKANQKAPLEKTQYDKELIKIDERVNVMYMTFMGDFLKIYPKPHDPNNSWFAPKKAMDMFATKDSDMIRLITTNYFTQLDDAIKTNNWTKANEGLSIIKEYQQIVGSRVIPSKEKIDFEVFYNDFNLFAKLVPYYLIIGILLIIFAFVHMIKPIFKIKSILTIAVVLLGIGFLVHIAGLGIRWYITDHAPWSNAYESIVFIALSTILAGLLLARKSVFALSATAILAGATMGVAHMSFINPEITPLVPVLKSYWLMIHVALIVGGDGFLGLGFILSLLALILFVIRNQNRPNIDRSIVELSALSEMSIIIGLAIFTIGNFLGGVWANESWGRYWGWDPKETWAAVTILVYAAVIHLRFIPKFKSHYLFNLASLWAYSSVLMTYFGVNYYLSGLHSYAAGDPMPIPDWVYAAIAVAFVLSLATFFKRDSKLKLNCEKT